MTTLQKTVGILMGTGVFIASYVSYNHWPGNEAGVGTNALKVGLEKKEAAAKNKMAAREVSYSRQEAQHQVPGYCNPMEAN